MKFWGQLVLFVTLMLLIGCGKAIAPGSWQPVKMEVANTYYELNFISPQVGWLTGWFEKGPEETEGWEILQTRNGGQTWEKLANQAENRLQYVYFINEQLGWGLTLDKDIVHTTDGGQTWAVQRKAGKVNVKYFYKNPQSPTEIPDPLAIVRFIGPNSGWAWGGGTRREKEYEKAGLFLRTEDGGQTWQSIPYPFENELKTVFFVDPKNGWAADTKAGLYKTVDGGQNWTKQPDDLQRPSINGIFFLNPAAGWVVGDSYVGITADGGQTWKRIKLKNRYLYDVNFIDANRGWAVGDKNTILSTTDGGVYWQPADSGLDDAATFTRVKFFADQSGWVAGNNGALTHYQVAK
jgi:photosystem II stability/assembly factor-like uncharacterized protein